jgi:DNA-directed RNA polymerase subunit RPC12/RpoP
MPEVAAIVCPVCQKRFKGKPELIGKKIKCPGCSEPFVVPANGETSTSPAKESATKPPPKPAAKPPKMELPEKPAKKAEVEAATDDAAYGVGRIDTAPRCPHCAKEMLSADAIICVHCGYNTLTRVHGETKKTIAATGQEHFIYLLPALGAATLVLAIIICLIIYSTVLTPAFAGTKMSWITHESARMWSTFALLFLIWGVGRFAFNTLVLAPKPAEVEKED